MTELRFTLTKSHEMNGKQADVYISDVSSFPNRFIQQKLNVVECVSLNPYLI